MQVRTPQQALRGWRYLRQQEVKEYGRRIYHARQRRTTLESVKQLRRHHTAMTKTHFHAKLFSLANNCPSPSSAVLPALVDIDLYSVQHVIKCN